MAGDFGSHSLYKNLGYFSLIGLLRLHTQLGDYYNALDSVKNVTISKKVRGGYNLGKCLINFGDLPAGIWPSVEGILVIILKYMS